MFHVFFPFVLTHRIDIDSSFLFFRCAELGDAISEYISDGIECSIRGYGASTWPERNSSTLLFASLMTRIFGVQRTRESDNLNIRNKMTGRIFFIRYPQLYDFFLSELKYSSEAIQRNDRPIRLHPLLLLVSRLYPSALEGSESNLKLSTFIPLISGCSSSPELVTRNLSAKSLVALIPPGNVVDRVFDILNELEVGFVKDYSKIEGNSFRSFHFISEFVQLDNERDAWISIADSISFPVNQIPHSSNSTRNFAQIHQSVHPV